jgi:hypothetical protein
MGVHYRDDQAGYALETSKAKQVVPCERQRGADEEVEDASPPPACELLGGGQRGVVVDGADVRGQIAVGMMAKIVSECPDRPVDLHGFVD